MPCPVMATVNAARPSGIARNSWLCACSRCPSPCSRPVPPAPTSSFQSLTSAVTSAETVLPAPSNEASEYPQSCGSPADSPLLILEKRRPPPIASGSCVTKRLPRNNHRAGSSSSCAGDTAAGPELPFIHALDRRKVQLVHHVGYEIGQVVIRQPLTQACGQQQILFRKVGAECFCHVRKLGTSSGSFSRIFSRMEWNSRTHS